MYKEPKCVCSCVSVDLSPNTHFMCKPNTLVPYYGL